MIFFFFFMGGERVEDTNEKTEQTTIRLPADLKKTLHDQANRMGISFNAYVLMILNLLKQNLHH